MKYHKKPVVVEAWQNVLTEVPRLIPEWLWGRGVGVVGGTLHIGTLKRTMTAQPGDWIIRGIKGELYPCKPDIFDATYELVESDS